MSNATAHIENHYDVLIAGGGMVGASLAVALSSTELGRRLSICVVEGFAVQGNAIEEHYQPSFDARSTALSYGSKCIYDALGLWPQVEKHVTPIDRIHVSDKGRFGSTEMGSKDEGLPALGYVVDNKWLGTVLMDVLAGMPNVDFMSPAKVVRAEFKENEAVVTVNRTMLDNVPGSKQEGKQAEVVKLQTQLLVVADGMRSKLCEQLGIAFEDKPYDKAAIVSNIETQKSHSGVAFERFTPDGPLAFLPLGGTVSSKQHSLVWTMDAEKAEIIMGLSDQDFLQRLQGQFGFRLGRMERVGERFSYPLCLVRAAEQARPNLVVVGNAAHSLHPVAGQGYNLALRGVARLASTLTEALAAGEDIGAAHVLSRYVDARHDDQQDTIRFSHLMATLFTSRDPAVGVARDLGLLGLDVMPGLKTLFVKQAAGMRR